MSFSICNKFLAATVIAFLLTFSSSLHAAQIKEAPSWQGTEWINLPPGQKSLDIRDFQGKVVYLSLFQKW